jgi:AcrR family transcriptional regulator
MIDTKTRILDAVERLVADHGLEVSLRAITAEAGVNLAAVNYHFQSKDALIDAMIDRRVDPVNRLRLEMLDALERDYPTGALPLEGVLEAFLAPLLQMENAEHVRILFGRLYSLPEEFLKRVFLRRLEPIVHRFTNAFERAMPDLPVRDRMTCMFLTIGAMVHVMAWSRMLPVISKGLVTADDSKDLTARVVNFAAAGFRAALENAQRQNEGIRHA